MTNREDILEARITAALEIPPTLTLPAGFAQRVSLRAAALPRPTFAPATHFGRTASYLALAVCLIAMLFLAPHALGHSTASLTLEFSLAAEFLALLVFLTLRPRLIR